MKTIKFIAYKTDSQIWAFDHEHNSTIAEPLCNGTESVIDEYFELFSNRKPKVGDEIEIIASIEELKESDTILSFQKTDNEGTTYLDMVLFENVWLCPWLQSYFGFIPSELYIKLTPLNKGLKNINKNYSNPFAKYLKKAKDENISGVS